MELGVLVADGDGDGGNGIGVGADLVGPAGF